MAKGKGVNTEILRGATKALISALNFVADERRMRSILESAGHAAGLQLMEIVGDEYPPPPPERGKVHPLQTERQRRWWWANMTRIAQGKGGVPDSLHGWKAAYRIVDGRKTLVLSGGYVRTGTLVRGINYEVYPAKSAVTVVLGTGMASDMQDAGYTKYVLGRPPEQAPIHQGRWTPLQDVVEGAMPKMLKVFREEVVEQLKVIIGEALKGRR